MNELIYLTRIGVTLFLGLIIGLEREQADKPAGLRTILSIMLGACLAVITTIEWDRIGIQNQFDSVRIIAYYLVAIGFVGGGIIGRKQGKIEGITTASLLLPISMIGFLCGMEKYVLAITTTLVLYFVLKLKHLRFKIQLFKKKRRKYHGKK